MKTCTKCHIEKDESEFYMRSESEGLRMDCKECVKKRVKTRSENKREEMKEYFKEYHIKNKDKRNSLKRESYKKNKDACIKRSNKWSFVNKEKRSVIQKRYVEKLTDAYLKNRLRADGYDSKTIEKLRLLIDKKRLDILIHRSGKLLKNIQYEQKFNRSNR